MRAKETMPMRCRCDANEWKVVRMKDMDMNGQIAETTGWK